MAVSSRSVKLDAPGKGSCRFTISYNVAISACEEGRQWQSALDLLSLMFHHPCLDKKLSMAISFTAAKLDAPVPPSVPVKKADNGKQLSYSSHISACEKGGQWLSAQNLLSLMLRSKVVPNVISYSAAIRACETGCQWQLALILLILNPLSKVLPDAISYDAAIRACQKGGQWQSAPKLVWLDALSQVVPHAISDNAASSAFEKGGQWQLFLNILSLLAMSVLCSPSENREV
eukprot:TRINITY_DN6135_c0_g1_i13.p1 TRINITY_DN6135_c0_g1~~TRINITY_DN6135_c0_g1_i13.p1  ORF type:complete len:232 (+),score=26.21 TRINITY_DN6135_c0_g1_i13:167-862(+)